MVLPDGTGSARNRPKSRRVTVFAVAGLVVIVGFIAIGSLSPSEPLATETSRSTSTTIEEIEAPLDAESFTVAQIATGEPLQWERVRTLGPGFPMEIVEHFGKLFLFTTSEPSWAGEPRGLTVWESSDGMGWARIGQVIDEGSRVTAVASTEQGLVAAGARIGSENLMVWRSVDGTDWVATEIPTEAESPYETPLATAIGATSEAIVVAAEIAVDRESIVAETSGSERNGHTPVWVLNDHGRWRTGTVPLEEVSEIIGRATGGLLALGRDGANRPAGFVSMDGLEWSATAPRPTPIEAVNRETFLVGSGDKLRPELLYSMLGGTWRKMGVHEALPPSPIRWSATAFGGGDQGVALAVMGHEEPARQTPAARGSTTLTSADGVSLTVDYERRQFVLLDGEMSHTWEMGPYPAQAPGGGLEVDLDYELIAFRDPDDGELLATFTFEDLQRGETRFRSIRLSEMVQYSHHILVLNTGALDWEIKDLGPAVAEGQVVRLVAVGLDHVVVLLDDATVVDDHPRGLEIWAAPLP